MSVQALASQPRILTVPRPSAPTAPTSDDRALLQAVRAGDPQAAAALHDRARPVVDRTVRRLLGSNDQSRDDLAQLALMELLRTIERFRGDCALDGWIGTIAAHVVYKEIRRRRSARTVFAPLALDEMDAPVASTRQGVHTAILRSVLHRVRELLAEIEENHAWTFLLHDVEGYSLREISQITGVSVAAAQSRLVRGRRELHEKIKADPELADELGHWGPTT